MTKSALREIKTALRGSRVTPQMVESLIATVEELQARTRRGESLSGPAEELPLAAKVNPAKKARGTQEEILTYAAELSLTANDATWFFEKMMENDWKVGKQPVKCWKGRMRTWKAGDFFPSQKQQQPRNGAPQAPRGPAQCVL